MQSNKLKFYWALRIWLQWISIFWFISDGTVVFVDDRNLNQCEDFHQQHDDFLLFLHFLHFLDFLLFLHFLHFLDFLYFLHELEPPDDDPHDPPPDDPPPNITPPDDPDIGTWTGTGTGTGTAAGFAVVAWLPLWQIQLEEPMLMGWLPEELHPHPVI